MAREHDLVTKDRIEGMEELVSITYAASWQDEVSKAVADIQDPIEKVGAIMAELHRIAVEEYRRSPGPYKYTLTIPYSDPNICAAFHVDIDSYVHEVPQPSGKPLRVISPMDCRRIEDAFAAAPEPNLEMLDPFAGAAKEMIVGPYMQGSYFGAGIDQQANRREELLKRRDLAVLFFRAAAAFGVSVRA